MRMVLSILGLVALSGSAHAAPPPPVSHKPVTKLPGSAALEVDPTIRVIDASGLTLAPLSKAQIARLAGVSPAALGESVTLSPSHPMDGTTYLSFHCAKSSDPYQDEIYFMGSLFDACGADVGVHVHLQVERGHSYMVDCVGDPGENNSWYFGRAGVSPWQEIKLAKERVVFVFEAPSDTHIGMWLRAKGKTSYRINRCTITPLGG